ncbi:AI-2E family transporter [Pleomorphomonas koreensis]|uniref:AI-2E family transporter n=1 Tax=Pleomorphomonas koreensis TaxID=257440 RepID=UPI0003FD4A22|nr:AI-2E family transporter [Pleomorphomonas koreensis]
MAQDPPSSIPAAPNAGEQGDIVRLAAWLIVAAAIIGGLYLGQGVLIPLAVAFLISFALSPPVTWLSRLGLPRVLSVVVVMLIAGVLLAGVGFLVGSQIKSLSAQLPTYQATVHAKLDDIRSRIRATGILDAVKEETAATAGPAAVVGPAQRIEVVQPSASPFETAIAWLAPALEPIATAGIVLVFVFLALIDRSDLRDRLIRLMGGNLHRSTSALEEAGKRISKYLLMQVVVNVTYAIPMALGLWFIGVPGWILWGALAALMRFVPYAGPLISAIFPVALAFAVDPGWNMVIWTVALILLLELISNNIVEPLLYGTSTGLSAMSLIAAATFWTALWGPVGLILSTPLTVCLLVVGRNLPQLQFLDTLLGSVPVLDVPTRIYQRLIADDPDEAIEIVEEAIGDGSVGDFYDEYGIEVLRRINDDRQGNARAEHRLRVASGMDLLLDDLREEYPPSLAPDTPPRVACIGGKREIDSVACEMLVHALSLDGLPAVERREGAATARYVDRLDLDGIEVICLSYFSRQPELSARTFCRRLRRRWPGRKIVVALWNAPDELLEPDRIEAMGADEAVASVDEAIHRIRLLLAPEEKLRAQMADTPDNDAERVAALEATGVLDGHAREDLDALAKRAAEVFDVRFAVISAVGADAEFIIGQSMELPGTRAGDGTDMITMPRDEAICDHVVASGETLVVDDTERDPRFSDHPAIKLWRTRFYAGAPLTTADGLVLGALCLLDSEPRQLDDEEVDLLGTMAANVVSAITGDAVVEPEQRAHDETSATVGQVVPE